MATSIPDATDRGRPPVTIVVATRDRPEQLRGCLEAIAATVGADDEVVVVDSASRQPAVAEVARRAGAALVRCARAGACRARNAGWRAGQHDLVLFTDDDCRPEPTWVAVTAAALAADADCAFVTGAVVADHDPRRAQLQTSLHTPPDHRRFDPPPPGHAPSVPAGGFGHGANMAWHRHALEAIGGFDELLGPGAPLRGAEDHDAFWRALRAGLHGRYVPASVVRHVQWRHRRAQLRAYFGYGVGTGAARVKQQRLAGAAGTAPLPWPELARLVGRTVLWDDGVRPVLRSLADHFEMGAAGEAVKSAGELVGVWRARRLVLDPAGRFVDRQS